MKHLIFLLLIVLNACSTFSQKKEGKLAIDTSLSNAFFDVPEYIVESTDSLFTDSILIGVNNYTDTTDDKGRSNIRELNRGHYSFYNCKSYFIGDTLSIEFQNKSKILEDKIVVKVIGNKFYSSFHFSEMNEVLTAESEQLIFKNIVDRKGQKIFGELKIRVPGTKSRQNLLFAGPFICTVE